MRWSIRFGALALAALALVGGADTADAHTRARPAKRAAHDGDGARPKGAKGDASGRSARKAPARSKQPPRAAAHRKGAKRRRAPSRHGHPAAPLSILERAIACPPDMVAVAGRVCVDRYEISLVDVASGAAWEPFYPPDVARAAELARTYEDLRSEAPAGSYGFELAVPPPPTRPIEPRAISAAGVSPQGYLSADRAEQACEAAGKRLCTEAEWVTACRGEEQRAFPYGESYEAGACNVYRESHPSFLLHGNASRYHDDPRNNLVEIDGRPLLRATGATPRCASRWGDDEIFDMVGNLDEWTSDPGGVFAGGFYARGTKSGCASRVSAHPRGYSDYSTGARCCADPRGG
jgi:hypothetical protein